MLDGGIEAINPDTNTADSQFAVSRRTMGGDIPAFVTVGPVVRLCDANAIPITLTLIGTALTQLRALNALPHLAINALNECMWWLRTRNQPRQGWIFDAVTDTESTTTPLNVGQLLPAFILFIE